MTAASGCRKPKATSAPPGQIPPEERDYFLERKYPSFGNLVPRDVASRNAKAVCDEGRGVGESGYGVYLDFADAIQRLGRHVIKDRYGNLFDMYERITGEDPYKVPMRIYPASHYTMGGLWVDYNLQSTIPGLYVIGEANFSDHGANRLGASALMQGLADGYFILPYTIGDYLAQTKFAKAGRHRTRRFTDAMRNVECQVKRLLEINGTRTVDSFHRELGKLMWEYCGMSRNGRGPDATRWRRFRELREQFWSEVRVLGIGRGLQPVAREGRPRGRFLRTGRADVPRRAGAQRILRRPLPRGVPDARRRSAARRRALFLRRRLGVQGCGRAAGDA